MTTEEERKAAARLLDAHLNKVAPGISLQVKPVLELACDLQCALTRTEKRLEVAEGLLREVADSVDDWNGEADMLDRVHAFLNPPAEGE